MQISNRSLIESLLCLVAQIADCIVYAVESVGYRHAKIVHLCKLVISKATDALLNAIQFVHHALIVESTLDGCIDGIRAAASAAVTAKSSKTAHHKRPEHSHSAHAAHAAKTEVSVAEYHS